MKAVLATTDENDNEMLVEKKEKKEKTLERERFVAWSRRLLAPGLSATGGPRCVT